MKRLILVMAATVLLAAGSAEATIVTFDDLVGSGTVANGYGGINWNGAWDYYDLVQPPYNPASPPERVYNNSRSNANSFFDLLQPAVFNGAFFAGFGTPVMANLIHFDLFYLGNPVFTSGTLDPSAVPTFLPSGYAGLVDRVHVISESGDFYVMDNVTYTVPEPASVSLLALGLAGLGLRRWRQQTA